MDARYKIAEAMMRGVGQPMAAFPDQRQDADMSLRGMASDLYQADQRRAQDYRAGIKEAILQSWPAELAKVPYNFADFANRVYQGKADPMSDEAIQRSADIAGLMTLGGGAGVPKGALGSTFSDPLMHGSPRAGLTELTPSVRGPLGPGVYTTPAPNVAGRYAGEGTTYTLPQRSRDIYNGLGHRYGDYAGTQADKARLIAAAEPQNREAIANLIERTYGEGYPLYARLRGDIYKGDEGAQSLFKRAGFEGLSGHVDGPEVLLFGKQELTAPATTRHE
jgi:hypothetical protein